MNDSKLLKILYGIICLMVVAFFGFGGYFIFHQSYGAGLLAVGIGLIGLGFTIFLGTGLIFAVDDDGSKTVYASSVSGKAVLSGKVQLKDILFTMDGVVNGQSAEVCVAENGFSVKFADSVIYAMLEDVKGVVKLASGDGFLMRGDFEQHMQIRNMLLQMTFDNKMRMKAFEKMFVNVGVPFMENESDLDVVFPMASQELTVPNNRQKLSDRIQK